jgi:hypothetical protein
MECFFGKSLIVDRYVNVDRDNHDAQRSISMGQRTMGFVQFQYSEFKPECQYNLLKKFSILRDRKHQK